MKWPIARAVLLFCLILLAVFLWNPRFTVAGLWNPWERGGSDQQRKNALTVLILGAATLGGVEWLRREYRRRNRPY